MPSQRTSILTSIGRIGRAVALAASLLTFPAAIGAMIVCWLLAYTAAVVRGERGAWLLCPPIAVVFVKRLDWPVGMWIFMAVALIAFVASIATFQRSPPRRRAWLPGVVWLAWLALAIDWHQAIHASHPVAPLDSRPIVCLGDSLTSYTKRGGYPEMLAGRVRVSVVNLGQPGVTSAEALKKLPDLLAEGPQAVVIELGGHDFLKDTSLLKTSSRAAAKRNLEQVIAAAKGAKAEIILIEVPRAFVADPYAGLERQLAREHDLELVSDTAIRQFVLSSPAAPPGMWLGGPYLSDDGLHPNDRGNRLLANRVLRALVRLYGPAIAR